MNHTFSKRIYGFECDIYGHLNNANYLPIYESARAEALQEVQMPIQRLLDLGWSLYVTRVETDFIKAVKLEEIISVYSKILEMDRLKSTWQQEMFNAQGELCNRSIIRVVHIYNGKPARVTPEIYEHFSRFLD